MNIADLQQSNEALRIRKFNREDNSKVLLDVRWHLLGNNKQPYLSVQVQQIIKDGVRARHWQDQKKALKKIDQDLFELINLHLSPLDGSDQNVGYFIDQCKEQFGKEVYTSQIYQQEKRQLEIELKDHVIFNYIAKIPPAYKEYLKEYMDQNNDRFKYLNKDRSIAHWKDQLNNIILKSYGVFKQKEQHKKVNTAIEDFFNKVEELKQLIDKYKYKSLPSKNDLWSVERLAKYLNITICNCYQLIGQTGNQYTLSKQEISERLKNINKNKLLRLTEKYNIPLVVTK